jgi:hypothetical protein
VDNLVNVRTLKGETKPAIFYRLFKNIISTSDAICFWMLLVMQKCGTKRTLYASARED